MLITDTILQQRYRIVRQLGRGGMGAVYEAFDERLSRTVAIKEALVETDDLRRAFEREARLLANLRHPGLPRVLDHFTEGTGLFLVMEFIPGDDLGVMLERQRLPFAPAEVLRWADQLLDALGYLHTLEPPVLHRDIKPSNLKLISRNQVVLLDFGLAKGSAGEMTRTGNTSILGYSPNYSPLEQIQGSGTDPRSDLYSLAATLYHLLTGVRPTDALTRATSVVNGQPDPLLPAHRVNEAVPAATSAALMRALALNIDNRPRTAQEMVEDLHDTQSRPNATVPMAEVDETTRVRLTQGRVAEMKPETGRERRQPLVVPVPEETWIEENRAASRWKWSAAIGLILGLIALSAVVYFSNFGRDDSRLAQSNQPIIKRSPTPSPSPSPSESPTPSPAPSPTPSLSPTPDVSPAASPGNLNSQPAASADEMAARAKLAQKNIPYTEQAFAQAVKDGDAAGVDLFLAAGMGPNVKDATGRTLLMNAASGGHENISRRLVSKGAGVDARDSTGSTALMEAASNDHKKTARVLLEGGADANLKDNNGQTALLRAAAQGHKDIVEMLLDAGAKIETKDKQGRDALTWAEINNHPDVVDLLKKAAAAKP